MTQTSIYVAGGCFWGVEEYFNRVDGVIDVTVGYANGYTEETHYQIIKDTGHVEAAHVTFDDETISLNDILLHLFRIIDPVSVNRQGNDRGTQYRTGIYYTDDAQKEVAQSALRTLQSQYKQPIAIELEPLKHYLLAEDYHQDYLKKNPNGYCHIDVSQASCPLDFVKK